jgi:hypothetical protein
MFKKSVLSFIVVGTFLLGSVFADQPVKHDIRDSGGKVVGTTTTRGKVTETRSPSGKLENKVIQTPHGTEVRSPSGKLLYKVK